MTAETMPVGEMPAREGDITIEGHGMEPIPETARYGSVSRVFTVWFTPNLVPAAFFIGTLVTLSFLQLGFWTSILAIIVGNLVGSVFVGAAGTMGPKTGMAQMPLARLPFGKSIVAAGAAELAQLHRLGRHQLRVRRDRADSILIRAAVLGCAAGHRRLPGRAGDHRLRGDPHLREVDGVRARRHVRGPDHRDRRPGQADTAPSTASAAPTRSARSSSSSPIIASFVLAWALYASDYTRYLPASTTTGSRVFWWTVLGLSLSAGWLEILGLLVADKATGGASSDTINTVLADPGPSRARWRCSRSAIGTVAVNAMNDYTGSLSLQAAGVRIQRVVLRHRRRRPRLPASPSGSSQRGLRRKFENFLLFISYWIAPLVGVVLADWWLRGRQRRRRRRLVDFARPAVRRPRRWSRWSSASSVAAVPELVARRRVRAGRSTAISANYLHYADLAYVVGGLVAFAIYWFGARSGAAAAPEAMPSA